MLGFIKYLGYSSYSLLEHIYRGIVSIVYQTSSGDFVYTTDTSDNMVLVNSGDSGSTNNGLLYSGRGIELGALNDVEFPIHHTLGADNKKLASSVDAGWTDNLDNTYTGSTVTGDIVGLTTLTSGTFKVTITLSSVTAGDVNGYTADGTYVFEETLTASLNLTGTGFTGIVTVVSAEQITNPNSYLTYYDFTDGLVTLGNSVDGGSSKELVDTANDATEWTAYGNNLVEEDVDGAIKVTYVDNASGAFVNIRETGGLSKDFTIGRTYQVIFTAKINTGAANVRVYDGVTNDTLLTNTEYQIFSVEIVPTSVAAYINFPAMGVGEIAWIKDISVKEILPISTKYTANSKTVNSFLTHTTPWSLGDWIKINNNPNLIGKLAIETLGATKTIPELDMVMDAGASADKWFMCADRQSGTLTCARTATSTTISSWVATIETNADQHPKGIQTRFFSLDANGIPTSYTLNILNYYSIDYDDTQFNPSSESAFWVEEVIAGAVYQHKYDGVNLTTYTDNVAGAPTAHSPENASYLLGKGVYPKVTADPYTTYQSKTFQVYTGSTYTNYDQSSRYTILAAL